MTSPSPSVDPVRERLQELRRVCNPATTTPLPWHCDSLVAGGYVINYETDHPAAGFVAEIADYGYDAALFIEAASKHMPSLVAALTAVLDLAAKHRHGALRWEDPLPVPEWVGLVESAVAAGLGVTP